jgi:3'(2'), 5'-bisphosphate nucleotidase
MLDTEKQKELLVNAAIAAVRAGHKIMPLFDSDDYEITMKSDNSPFSLADKLAHEEIENCLAKTRIPILSEEGRDRSYEERKAWDIFWLIDPLDGTRQFIKKLPEFTVNIALIVNNYPEIGLIYAPIDNILYVGGLQIGSYKITNPDINNDTEINFDNMLINAVKLPTNSADVYTILTSPNHTTHQTNIFIDEMRALHNNIKIIPMGSSLKMCILAEGKADVYVRHADTYEWDTGAAQAILEGAGCCIKSLYNNQRISYNKESLINPWFICQRDAF